MAEGLFRHATKGKGDFRVLSAGVGAIDGQPPSAHAVRALKELQIDISRQRSRMLTGEVIQQADYIFGMTHGHVDAITLLYPQAADKVFVLREFDETLDTFEKDIADPIGGSYEVYLNVRDQIEQGIVSMLKFLEQSEAATAPNIKGGPTHLIALGSDHAGYQLKQHLREHLERQGIKLKDVGANSPESVDYPDFARAVAEQVANNQSHFGILVCGSGVGMSIAANKVPGVRAALVFNEEMAALARQHNDANVLCLGEKFVSPETAARIIDTFLNSNFEGGRHERRVGKFEDSSTPPYLHLRFVDPAIHDAIQLEKDRQQENIELIAS